MPSKIEQIADALAQKEERGLNLTNMADVQMERLSWIWEKFLAKKKLTILGGLPGTGKTTAVMSWVAAETSGAPFPNSSNRGGGGRVIIMSAEDDPADTLKPRLDAAGADMSRIFIVDSVTRDEDGEPVERAFSIARDIADLRVTLTKLRDVSMVVFDPLSAYLGAKDSHRDADVRQILGPLTKLAEDYRVSIVGITHLNKNEGHSAMARFMGSTAIIAAARLSFLTAPYEDSYILAPVKSNIGRSNSAMVYDIESALLHEFSPALETSRTKWLHEVEITADEVLNSSKERERKPREIEAEDFLREQLANGPRKAKEIEAAQKREGIAEKTLYRAKKNLNICSYRDDFAGSWWWCTQDQIDERSTKMAMSDDHLREGGMSQARVNDHLRKNKPLKPASDKALHEDGQNSENMAFFDNFSEVETHSSTKMAKCTRLGPPSGLYEVSVLEGDRKKVVL